MANNLVATNVRFPEDKLLTYRQIALEMGKSLSELINEVMDDTMREIVLTGKVSKKRTRKTVWEKAPIWNYKKYAKWASGIKDGAKNHDKYIYT